MRYVKLAFFCVLAFAIANAFWTATDPKFHQRLDAERQAKQSAANEKQREYVDSWRKWYDEAKKKNADAKKEPADPNWELGFQSGYVAAHTLARGGAERPATAKVDGMSRLAATASDLEDASRLQFTAGYKAGFQYGWNDGK